jgi:aspartate/methionine/tyrosine aminotransferase
MARIEPFHAMDVLAQARLLERQGRSIVHMEIGEPDFSTPEPVVEAGVKALRDGLTHYTPAVGLTALREAIAGYYSERYGVEVSPERIIITPGASGALQLVMGVLVGPGDGVLMADPGYPCNRHFVRQYEGQSMEIPTSAEVGYQLNCGLLSTHWREHCIGVILASPSNPTGTVISYEDLRAMADFTRAKRAVLIVDEIYHGLVYETTAPTALTLGDHVFVINSFSKYFGMTGWRLGWVVAPEAYIRELDKLAQNIFLAAATPSQHAALAAFKPTTLDILDQRREIFRQRRDFLLPALRDLGFRIPITPQGAFYLYANCEQFTDDSTRWSQHLLTKAGVALTPGIDFGRHQAAKHMRFAYTTSIENLERGVERLGRFLSL